MDMNQSTNPSFKIKCPKCDVAHESDEFAETSQFANKHNEHTGHDMEWVRAEFDYDIGSYNEWELCCDVCNEVWQFESEEAANNFRQEHAEYTDHEITNPLREQSVELSIGDIEDDDARSLKSFIAELEDHYDEGVPEQAIYAQISGDINRITKVQHKLNQLKKKGEVYELQSGLFQTI